MKQFNAVFDSPCQRVAAGAAKENEFIIVRNSFADNPGPYGWPGIGTEYRVEDEKLLRTTLA